MARETGVQSQVESYQRLKKWYLIPPCLTLSIIRYVSRVKWSNPGKGVALSPTSQCSSYWKGSLRVALDYGRQLYFIYIYLYKCAYSLYSGYLWTNMYKMDSQCLYIYIYEYIVCLWIIYIYIYIWKKIMDSNPTICEEKLTTSNPNRK